MPELVARSGLEHVVVPGRVGASTDAPGVSIALVQDRALAAVIARRNRSPEVPDLPRVPRVVTRSAMSFVWAGPGRWLAMAERISGEAFLKQLREQLGELASAIDQSDARILVRLAGPHAHDVLAKGVLIDLHPRMFQAGDTALTSFGHVRAHFWQTDATPTYEIAVMRSYAAAFWHWLMEAAAGYGVLVE
jgi:heterotetrameric sarcosine oxidase gamma subunit